MWKIFAQTLCDHERSDLRLLRFLLLVAFRGIFLFRVLCGREFLHWSIRSLLWLLSTP